MRQFLHVAWVVMKKDLTVEVRSREIVSTTLFFAVSCVLVFAIAFVREGRPLTDAGAGILWVAVQFSGTLALGRAFERERQTETLQALMLAPADRPAIYLGKLLGMLAFLFTTELLIVPAVSMLFQMPLFDRVVPMVLLLLVGTVGFSVVGTLFAAMLARARSRGVLLHLLLYPMTVPVMIAGVMGTVALTQPDGPEELVWFWINLLVFFDVVFLTLSMWTFEPLMTD